MCLLVPEYDDQNRPVRQMIQDALAKLIHNIEFGKKFKQYIDGE